MRFRKVTLALLVWVGLDFGSPYVGGAFAFSADESIEGVCLEQKARAERAVVGPVVPVPDVTESARVVRRDAAARPAPPRPGWLSEPRRALAVVPSSPPAGDDH